MKAPAAAIVIAAVLLGAVQLVLNRWQVTPADHVAMRLDRWTGRIETCVPDNRSLEDFDIGMKHCNGSGPTPGH